MHGGDNRRRYTCHVEHARFENKTPGCAWMTLPTQYATKDKLSEEKWLHILTWVLSKIVQCQGSVVFSCSRVFLLHSLHLNISKAFHPHLLLIRQAIPHLAPVVTENTFTLDGIIGFHWISVDSQMSEKHFFNPSGPLSSCTQALVDVLGCSNTRMDPPPAYDD